MDILQWIQRSDFGQLAHLILAELRNAAGDVVHAGEGALAQDGSRGFFTQPAHVTEAQAHGGFCEIRSYRAQPIRAGDVHWQDPHAVPLSVLHQGGGMIKPHGLIVQQRSGEGGMIVDLQPGAGIGEQCEAGGVRFGESV
jgi:hypothetical protein